jgi:hypothetical protein
MYTDPYMTDEKVLRQLHQELNESFLEYQRAHDASASMERDMKNNEWTDTYILALRVEGGACIRYREALDRLSGIVGTFRSESLVTKGEGRG